MTPDTTQSLDQLDPFDHAFVDVLLHLRGIHEPPSYEEFNDALQELTAFYGALELAPPNTTALDDEWLEGESIDFAASQLAFLYHQFGVLYRSQATPTQLVAFQRWWATGDESVGYAAWCPSCG